MGKVLYPTKENPKGETITFDDHYSFKDFTNQKLIGPLKDKVIYASCFAQNTLDNHIFPDDMTGVKFYNCNLDNVYIPMGNEVIGGSQRRLKAQNDLNIWVIDKNNNPLEPVDKKIYLKLGLSIKPVDLPTNKLSVNIFETKQRELLEGRTSGS